MITLEAFESTVDYILDKYNIHDYYYCMISENNFKMFMWSKYTNSIIKMLPTHGIKIRYNIYFDPVNYMKNNIIDIFCGPRIAQVEILTENQRTIKDIIQ